MNDGSAPVRVMQEQQREIPTSLPHRLWKSAIVRPEFVTLLVLVLFEAYLITSSEGFHKIDEGAHFINNVNVVKDPSISIGVWQRFGRVWLFALPAQVGHKTVKVFAVLLFLLTIAVTYKVADIEHIPGAASVRVPLLVIPHPKCNER